MPLSLYLWYQVDITANALLLYHDPGSLRTWLGLGANVQHYLRYSEYSRLRPQVLPAWLLARLAEDTLDQRPV